MKVSKKEKGVDVECEIGGGNRPFDCAPFDRLRAGRAGSSALLEFYEGSSCLHENFSRVNFAFGEKAATQRRGVREPRPKDGANQEGIPISSGCCFFHGQTSLTVALITTPHLRFLR